MTNKSKADFSGLPEEIKQDAEAIMDKLNSRTAPAATQNMVVAVCADTAVKNYIKSLVRARYNGLFTDYEIENAINLCCKGTITRWEQLLSCVLKKLHGIQ